MDTSNPNQNGTGQPAPVPSTGPDGIKSPVTPLPTAPYPLDQTPGSTPNSPIQPATNLFLKPEAAQADAAPAPSDEEPDSALAKVAKSFTGILGAVFSWVIFPVAVVLILHNFVFQAYHVLGTSMAPNLQNADYLIISKLGYTTALVQRAFNQNAVYIPKRGEIIVFRYPKKVEEVFVKRVIGIPGDRVVIKDGKVTLFTPEHPEGYNPDTGYETSDTITLGNVDETVQAGNVYVIGDNRAPGGSFDSREWGELPSSYIIGNAVLRLLPLDQVKIL